jgi:hypothetical protein
MTDLAYEFLVMTDLAYEFLVVLRCCSLFMLHTALFSLTFSISFPMVASGIKAMRICIISEPA